jgi:hypothetical protein
MDDRSWMPDEHRQAAPYSTSTNYSTYLRERIHVRLHLRLRLLPALELATRLA